MTGFEGMTMKKRVCILLLIILGALSVAAACGSKEDAQASDSVASYMVLSETVEASEANQETTAINMTVSTDTTDFTLEKAEFTIACLN